jgi:hypothetical protein
MSLSLSSQGRANPSFYPNGNWASSTVAELVLDDWLDRSGLVY